MKKDEKNCVEFVVLNCFIRVLKDNNEYMLYRRCVNNTGIMKSILKKQARLSSDNPFSKASSSNEVIKTLQKITDEMSRSNGHRGGIKDMDRYEHVTMTINHLLHFFMESNGISMQRLCELGEKIYSISCNKLFGDTIEDLEKQSQEEMNSISNNEQLKAKLFQEFIKGLQNGSIPSSMNFDEYIRSRTDIQNIDEMGDISHFAEGHMLGEGPDGAGRMRRPAWLDSEPDPWND